MLKVLLVVEQCVNSIRSDNTRSGKISLFVVLECFTHMETQPLADGGLHIPIIGTRDIGHRGDFFGLIRRTGLNAPSEFKSATLGSTP